MSSVYRGSVCPDCRGEGRIDHCDQCGGVGTLLCDICNGTRRRAVPDPEGGSRMVECVCHNGRFACATCNGGSGTCGRCAGTGFLEGN